MQRCGKMSKRGMRMRHLPTWWMDIYPYPAICQHLNNPYLHIKINNTDKRGRFLPLFSKCPQKRGEITESPDFVPSSSDLWAFPPPDWPFWRSLHLIHHPIQWPIDTWIWGKASEANALGSLPFLVPAGYSQSPPIHSCIDQRGWQQQSGDYQWRSPNWVNSPPRCWIADTLKKRQKTVEKINSYLSGNRVESQKASGKWRAVCPLLRECTHSGWLRSPLSLPQSRHWRWSLRLQWSNHN
jgi:hypothetical protein